MTLDEAKDLKHLFRLHTGDDEGTQKDFNDLFYDLYKRAKRKLKETDLIVEK